MLYILLRLSTWRKTWRKTCCSCTNYIFGSSFYLVGKFFFFCHNFLFDRPSTTSRTSVSLNNELGNWLNNPVHNISNGSILVCLGHELNTIDRTIWDLLRYEITCEQKDFMSYSCGKKVHLFVYTKKECGFPAIGKKICAIKVVFILILFKNFRVMFN